MATIRALVTAKSGSAIAGLGRHEFSPHKLDRRAALRADKTGLAAMPPNLKTAFRTTHHPGLGREIQRMASCRAAADLPRLAPPHRIMAMARTDQRMGNLMKDGIADVIIL